MRRPPSRPTLFPYTTLFRSRELVVAGAVRRELPQQRQRDRRQVPYSKHANLLDTGTNAAAPHGATTTDTWIRGRSEEHTSELQSRRDLVCRLLLEKKKIRTK